MSRLPAILLALLALLSAGPAHAQLPPGEKAMAVELVAQDDAPAAGGKVALAIRMSPRSGWHGYWKNPGDAGVETRIDWRLPPGVKAGPILYPVPKTLIVAGFMNYVYEGPYALLLDLNVPSGLRPGTVLPLRAKLFYLVCTDRICVPEQADLALDLPVASPGAPPRSPGAFDVYRQKLPRPLGAEARFERNGDRLRIAVPLPAAVPLPDPYFFPATLDAVDHSAPQSLSRSGDLLIVELGAGRARTRAIDGVLRLAEGEGLAFTARPGPVPAAGIPVAGAPAPADGGGGIGLLLAALGAALLGGLLLNVMPCVFPILSLKALGLAQAGARAEKNARREALAYAAGVVLTCLALGGLLLALRAGGAAIGWAFQLQDPRVILLLLLLTTAIALSLIGLFDLPAVGAGDGLARAGGTAGAFWTGALAAFVATPCIGPFMGAAMGAALLLPSAAALAIFAGLGLGLAAPFLLLGFVPALRRRLPRPGPWMARFRRWMALPMFLTALGLAWVLERQTGARGLAVGLAACLLAGFALWQAGRRRAWTAFAPALAIAGAALVFLPVPSAPAAAPGEALLGAEPFSERRLNALRSEGRPVFVYFTADWCLTCKVNEANVLASAEVADAFAERKVAVLAGDWTRGDPEIGRFLEKQGRSGVPLYIFYPVGRPPEILPQLLTERRLTELTAQ